MATKANIGHIGTSGIAGHSAGELFPYRIVVHKDNKGRGVIHGVGPDNEHHTSMMFTTPKEFETAHDHVEGHLRAIKSSMEAAGHHSSARKPRRAGEGLLEEDV